MSKKLTIEKVKNEFEKRNLILIEKNYINNHTNMKYICKIHNDKIQTIRYGNLISGKGCKYCGIENRASKRRNSISKIIQNLRDIQFELLNPENYKNNASKILVKCKYGHEFETNYNNLIKRKCCKICESRIPLTEDRVKETVENKGYKLLSFKNSQSDILVECPNGHITNIGWDRFKKGQKCVECTGNGKYKYTYEQANGIFKENNLTLVSEEYKNTKDKLDFICENGHKGSMSLCNVLIGHGCSACRYIKAVQTMIKNETVSTSKQQKFIHNVVGGQLNFPFNKFALDIAFPNEKVYLEYDGGGHFLKVTFGEISIEEFQRKEMIRSKMLREKGWKEIRIISKLDKIPTKESILEMMDYARNYLDTGRHHIIFNLDEGTVKTSLFKINYNYGRLSEI